MGQMSRRITTFIAFRMNEFIRLHLLSDKTGTTTTAPLCTDIAEMSYSDEAVQLILAFVNQWLDNWVADSAKSARRRTHQLHSSSKSPPGEMKQVVVEEDALGHLSDSMFQHVVQEIVESQMEHRKNPPG